MLAVAYFIRIFFWAIPVVCVLQVKCSAQKDSVWIKAIDGCKIHNPHPIKNEKITWSGQCSSGYATGEGTLTWFRNEKLNQEYTGEMRRGIPNGRGRYLYEDGTIHEGTYVNGDLNGFGKIVRTDKRGRVYYLYQGLFKEDVYSGYGEEIFFLENGDTSSVHKGEFFGGERHGEGVRKEFAGNYLTVVKGTFDNGKLSGKVEIHEYYQSDLLVSYNGQFKDGGRNGLGESFQGSTRYTGEWKENKREGKGKIFLDSMLIYDGDWWNDKFNGTGKRFFFDGSYYVGQFKGNRRHGVGMQCWQDGTKYIGEFKDDVYKGYGYFTTGVNVRSCGLWESGRLLFSDNFRKTRDLLATRYKNELAQLGVTLN